MADPIKIESVDATLSVRPGESTSSTPDSDMPFRLLIMGDFSGRSNRGLETDGSDIAKRKMVIVDRDNDEAVMEKLGVAVHLPSGGTETPMIKLPFSEIDDFSPDNIFSQAEIFKVLRETRKRLSHADTFAETAALLTGKPAEKDHAASHVPASGPTNAPDFSRETTSGLLDEILEAGSHAAGESTKRAPSTQWDRFLGDIVAPHLVPNIEKEQYTLIQIIDDAISQTMASILHYPDFQHLEAAWRAIRFLVRRLETGENLTLYLLDISKSELAADLTTTENLEDTGMFQLLAATSPETSGRDHWGAIIGNFTFDRTKRDVVMLARMGAICRHLEAPFIGGAHSRIVGAASIARTPDPAHWKIEASPEDEKAWQVIRKLPEAAWIGLAMPRFLLRLPYGEKTDAVDTFDFEEMAVPPDHDHYLWANPGFACALVLGTTFTRHGWTFSNGIESDIEGLPLHLFDCDGESVTVPCTEALLTDRALDMLMEKGVMALVSFKNQDRARLVRLQSIASPPTALGGRWWQG